MRVEKMVEKVLGSIEQVIVYIENAKGQRAFDTYSQAFVDVVAAMKDVNIELFQSEEMEGYLIPVAEKEEEVEESLLAYRRWLFQVKSVVAFRKTLKNNLDYDFYALVDYIKYTKEETIFQQVLQSLHSNDAEIITAYNKYYQKYHYMWGSLDTEKGCYDVVINRVEALKLHYMDFVALYEKLMDYRSKNVLRCTLYSWISFDVKFIGQMKEANFLDYYDLDLLQCDENEVMVDLGAYTGDSVLDYIDTYGVYKKIYCYEITPSTVEQMKNNLAEYKNIDIRNKGVGKENDVMYLSSEEASSSNVATKEQQGIPVEIVTLDDDIQEEITLIKMDIEGAEQNAILGCKGHIQKEKPKLLVCVYHNNEDIWKIPQMITQMRDDYRFYLRSNGGQWGPAELVLFAL